VGQVVFYERLPIENLTEGVCQLCAGLTILSKQLPERTFNFNENVLVARLSHYEIGHALAKPQFRPRPDVRRA
jgi:hypothetical protein